MQQNSRTRLPDLCAHIVLPGCEGLVAHIQDAYLVQTNSLLVSRLEEEGVNNENGIHVLGPFASLKQGRVVMQAQTLAQHGGPTSVLQDKSRKESVVTF